MSDNKDKERFSKKELLHECWSEQRQEITYRRDREQLVFQTSATVWVGLLGALLVNGQTENPFLRESGIVGKILLTFTVLLAAVITNGWIKKQRLARIKNQQALAEIQKQCGCFEPDATGASVLPKQFHDDWAKNPFDTTHKKQKGSFKHWWSWLLPAIVIAIIWLPNWDSHPVPDKKPPTPQTSQKPTP